MKADSVIDYCYICGHQRLVKIYVVMTDLKEIKLCEWCASMIGVSRIGVN